MYDKIMAVYPELTEDSFYIGGSIMLKDDGDGVVYIAKWEYTNPLPAGMKVGK